MSASTREIFRAPVSVDGAPAVARKLPSVDPPVARRRPPPAARREGHSLIVYVDPFYRYLLSSRSRPASPRKSPAAARPPPARRSPARQPAGHSHGNIPRAAFSRRRARPRSKTAKCHFGRRRRRRRPEDKTPPHSIRRTGMGVPALEPFSPGAEIRPPPAARRAFNNSPAVNPIGTPFVERLVRACAPLPARSRAPTRDDSDGALHATAMFINSPAARRAFNNSPAVSPIETPFAGRLVRACARLPARSRAPIRDDSDGARNRRRGRSIQRLCV